MIPTVDPHVVIESQAPGVVVYRQTTTGARWRIRGTCCCCGACEVGAVNPWLRWQGPVGTPMACVDIRGMDRPDVPVTPELPIRMAPYCTLAGEWL